MKLVGNKDYLAAQIMQVLTERSPNESAVHAQTAPNSQDHQVLQKSQWHFLLHPRREQMYGPTRQVTCAVYQFFLLLSLSLHSTTTPKHAHVSVCVYLSTYPLRTPLSWGSGGGCHWTIMDWFVRPLATIFFGGALGASSLSMSLTHTDREKEREGHRKIIMNRVY